MSMVGLSARLAAVPCPYFPRGEVLFNFAKSTVTTYRQYSVNEQRKERPKVWVVALFNAV